MFFFKGGKRLYLTMVMCMKASATRRANFTAMAFFVGTTRKIRDAALDLRAPTREASVRALVASNTPTEK